MVFPIRNNSEIQNKRAILAMLEDSRNIRTCFFINACAKEHT